MRWPKADTPRKSVYNVCRRKCKHNHTGPHASPWKTLAGSSGFQGSVPPSCPGPRAPGRIQVGG